MSCDWQGEEKWAPATYLQMAKQSETLGHHSRRESTHLSPPNSALDGVWLCKGCLFVDVCSVNQAPTSSLPTRHCNWNPLLPSPFLATESTPPLVYPAHRFVYQLGPSQVTSLAERIKSPQFDTEEIKQQFP